jgi:formylglycine-generating enzyme required for sulfatase activity
MMSRIPLVAAFALGVSACRVAGPDELVGTVPAAAAHVDAGVVAPDGAPASDPPVPRQPTPTCSNDPPADPSKMVSVPAGAFMMGCNAAVDDECRADEKPGHEVTLKAFSIDATEVTQAQYYECVKAGACLAPSCDWEPCGARAEHPVVCVNRVDALAYCKFQNKRLPTEAEWEKAARGTEAPKFPWGNDPVDCTRANIAGCVGGTVPVGSYPTGISPYGALDMAGNVVEWVSDVYNPTYYAVSPAADPPGPAATPQYDQFVGRGGGWQGVAIWHRASSRDDYEAAYLKSTFGIRCASDS